MDPNSSPTKEEVSKVLHVRNLPVDCVEHELITIAAAFGKVKNVLILKGKNQAFIEMEKKNSATALIDYYISIQASIRGRPIYFQYSTRTEVNSNPNYNDHPVPIILVTVLNMLYPVTIDILHQVFSKFGLVQKIVTFQKKAGFQSLIQFSTVEEASNAKRALDGQNIYSGCCTLRIQFSSTLSDLNVKVNNDRTRDFVNALPSAPSPPLNSQHSISMFGIEAPVSSSYRVMPNNSTSQSVCFVRNLDPERITPDILFTLFGVYGDVTRVKILFHKPNTALVQFVNARQCQVAIQNLNGCPLHDRKLVVNLSMINNILIRKDESAEESDKFTKDYSTSTLHRYRIEGSKNFAHICPPSTVLHISNIDPNVTEDAITKLFGQFGEVVAIKILSQSNKKMAVIQLATLPQAVEALVNLHNYRIENIPTFLRVSFSKHMRGVN